MSYSYFAFLDVMGYRYHLQKDLQDGTENFKEKLISSHRAFEGVDTSSLGYKSISDSIFMNCSQDVVSFLKVTKSVFLNFLKNGLLIRGGIAYNKHFETPHITYSSALADAYSLESSKSIFPRILIDKAVIEKLRNEHSSARGISEYQRLIDEKLILRVGEHYQLHVIDDESWQETYNNAKNVFSENSDIISSDPKVFEYHNWLQTYIFMFKPKGLRSKKYIETLQPL